MKRKRTIVVAGVFIVAAMLAVLGLWLVLSPLAVVEPGGQLSGDLFDPNTPVGRVFASASECAERQKDLYGYVEAYRQKHGRVPADIKALLDDDLRCMYCTYCPLQAPYRIFPENYGKAEAVFIAESQNKHAGAFKLWIRGIRPQVQTMGDGTIPLFNDGKLATRHVTRK